LITISSQLPDFSAVWPSSNPAPDHPCAHLSTCSEFSHAPWSLVRL
jgi:hypothetical protein